MKSRSTILKDKTEQHTALTEQLSQMCITSA